MTNHSLGQRERRRLRALEEARVAKRNSAWLRKFVYVLITIVISNLAARLYHSLHPKPTVIPIAFIEPTAANPTATPTITDLEEWYTSVFNALSSSQSSPTTETPGVIETIVDEATFQTSYPAPTEVPLPPQKKRQWNPLAPIQSAYEVSTPPTTPTSQPPPLFQRPVRTVPRPIIKTTKQALATNEATTGTETMPAMTMPMGTGMQPMTMPMKTTTAPSPQTAAPAAHKVRRQIPNPLSAISNLYFPTTETATETETALQGDGGGGKERGEGGKEGGGRFKKASANFSKKYRRTEEERADVLMAYSRHKGDLWKILDTVMLSELDDHPRFVTMIQKAIADGKVKEFPLFKKTSEDKKEVAKRKKAVEKEAKEAMEEMKSRKNKKKQGGGGDGGKGGAVPPGRCEAGSGEGEGAVAFFLGFLVTIVQWSGVLLGWF
ncbi:DnaJ sub C member 9 [Rhizophlyctis rosea]|nr:DnaJ sub C member 9 [Rhizophlyctis rosea]